MPEQKRTTETQDEKLRRQEIKQEAAAREAARQAAFAASGGGPVGPPDDIPIRSVAARLRDRRFQTAQRQAMAERIRRVSGNRYLHKAVAQTRQREPVGETGSAWPQQAAVERDAEGTPESTAAKQGAALGPVAGDVVARAPAQPPASVGSRSTHDSRRVQMRAGGPPPSKRQLQGSVGAGIIQLSRVSDELEIMWSLGERQAFFERLRNLEASDPDVVGFVEHTLTGEDLRRARSLLGLEEPPSAPRAGEEAGEAPEGGSATGGPEGGQTVVMVYRGRRVVGTTEDLRRFTANQIRRLDARIYGASYSHESFVSDRRYSPVRWICDLPANLTDLMGVTSRGLPDVAMWQVPRRLLAQARASHESGDYQAALRQLGRAAQAYNARAARWYSYIRGTAVRAQDVATGLEVFSSVSISIGVTVLTAGSGPLVSAAVAGGVMAIRELGRETAERALGVDPEFNVERFFTAVLTSAASNFVGSLLQGPLQTTFARLFPRSIRHIRDLGPINRILREAGASPVTRTSLQSWTSRYIGVLMARIPINTLNGLAAEVFREFAESETTPSEESLLERFADGLAQSMTADVIARAIIESTAGR